MVECRCSVDRALFSVIDPAFPISTSQHPTFRERSETPELSTEISLQPWRNYKTDGVILFSDILTPLPVSEAEIEG